LEVIMKSGVFSSPSLSRFLVFFTLILTACMAEFPLEVPGGDGPAQAVSPYIRVQAFKTSYRPGQSINTAADLAVFVRDLSTGEEVRIGPSAFTIQPAGPLAEGNNPVEVKVTAADYPAPNTYSYNIWVEAPSSTVPAAEIQVYPFKTSYASSDSINPAADLKVYIRNLSTGEMEEVLYGAGAFTLSIGAAPPPSPLTLSAGTHTVTVTVPGYPPGADVDTTGAYTI
jgi:hypothetical protein